MTEEKANIIITRVYVPSDAKLFFTEWQSKFNEIIANFRGFLSLEILTLNEEQTAWTLVQRFSDESCALIWKQSIEREQMLNELKSVINVNIEEITSKESFFNGITEVIITEVSPEKEDFYSAWLSKIHQAEAKMPGFRGMYVQSPIKDKGRHWITFLQFDSAENLDLWLSSKERKSLLEELHPMIKALESHRVITSYAGWFQSIAKSGTIPPVWKQTMLVLLVLFPIVMFEMKYLNTLTHFLNISLATFIGNALSVVLIAWPMMPIAIYFFRWWLTPQAWNLKKVNRLGIIILLAIYLIEIIIFWNFVYR